MICHLKILLSFSCIFRKILSGVMQQPVTVPLKFYWFSEVLVGIERKEE
jgi:hypothetical protein